MSAMIPHVLLLDPDIQDILRADDRGFCQAMLPLVSRTFAACIDLLPNPVDHQVLIAYLLCRIADTIEDTADLPPERKQVLLDAFARSLDDNGDNPADLPGTFQQPDTPDELLARECLRVLRQYRDFPPTVRDAIRPWVQEMSRGMASFAVLHAQARPGNVVALASLADLDRYCYYVAGTVGHLLTDLFLLHTRSIDQPCYQRMKDLATGFGLGLQLVNIIKDVADDQQRGWSFVPHDLCREAGISPAELLAASKSNAAQVVMSRMISKAAGHLDQALDYCTAIPRSQYRLRLFCLTPLLFAVRTLHLAERDPRLLDPLHKVKITRKQVYRTILMSRLAAPSNGLVRWYYRRLAATG